MPRPKTIIAAADSNNLAEYERLAAFVKGAGFAAMGCDAMAEDTPEQRYDPDDSWLRYLTRSGAFMKLVETPLFAGIITKAHREKNAALLKAKSDILARHGLGGVITFLEPQILPESFYAARPDMRGPRCDQPCVALNPYYAPCIDHPEVLAHYREATRKLLEMAPSIAAINIWTNDSGAGICWCSGLYPDPNGPDRCRGVAMGPRIGNWMRAILAGAADAGRKVEVNFNPVHFSRGEKHDVIDNLPPHANLIVQSGLFPNYPFNSDDSRDYIDRLARAGRKAVLPVDPTLGYPMAPVVEPPLVYFILDRLREAAALGAPVIAVGGIHPSFGGAQTVATEATLSGAMRPPKSWTEIERRVAKIAKDHVGPRLAPALVGAWRDIDFALRLWPHNADTNHHLYIFYGVLGDRWLTRPLAPAPALVTDAEKAYYMKGRHLSANREEMDSFFVAEGTKCYRTAEFKGLVALYDEMMLYAGRAVATLDAAAGRAAAEAPDLRERFMLQMGRVAAVRAVWRTQRNVLMCGSIIEFFTGEDRERYWHGIRVDESCLEPATYRRLFLEAVDDEIANCREIIRLMAGSPAPLIATGEPESFYVKHPHLRGARCDNPCVATNDWYSPCVDRKEVLAHYREGTRKLLEMAPEIGMILILTNDSGAGICWCTGLYPGVNGPAHCKDVEMGLRMRRWFEAILAGAADAGRKVEVFFSPLHFGREEVFSTIRELPRRARVVLRTSEAAAPNSPFVEPETALYLAEAKRLGKSAVVQCDPSASWPLVPLGESPMPYFVLDTLSEMAACPADSVMMGGIRPPVLGIDTVTTMATMAGLKRTPEGAVDIARTVVKIAKAHVGPRLAETLASAWADMDRAFRRWPHASDTNHKLNFFYSNLDDRWTNRPIVPAPARLSKEEREYYDRFRQHRPDHPRYDSFFLSEDMENYKIDEMKWLVAALDEVMLYANRAIARLEVAMPALEGEGGEVKARFLLQYRRAAMLRAFWRTQRNVCRAQSIIDFFTGDRQAEYWNVIRRDETFLMPATYRRLFLEAMDDEAANCREMITLMRDSDVPLLALSDQEGPFAFSRDLPRQLERKISIMEAHKADIDFLFPDCPGETFTDPTYEWADRGA